MKSGVAFTGFHIHWIDYNRNQFANFLNNSNPASTMVEGSGHLFHTIYNQFGEVVQSRRKVVLGAIRLYPMDRGGLQ